MVVQAAILDARRGVLLAVRRDLQGWELPGGRREPGETDEEALTRELREELGIEVTVGRWVGAWKRTGYRPHTAHVYVCETPDEPGRHGPLGEETLTARWHDPAQLPETLFPWYREPLALALAAAAAPVERHERNGPAAIWAGARIDWRMRLARLRRDD
ncbi:MAG: NUDIX hydrolase [Myxococcota bacterium]|nr:NUDIX hydrolase [Myxococcota bacterium]